MAVVDIVFLYVDQDIIMDMVDDIDTVATMLGIQLRTEVRDGVPLAAGLGSELIVAGQQLGTVIVPVIAFYLGRGRLIRLTAHGKTYVFRGYRARDITKLFEALNADPSPDHERGVVGRKQKLPTDEE